MNNKQILYFSVTVGDKLLIRRDGRKKDELFLVTNLTMSDNGMGEVTLKSANMVHPKKTFITISNGIRIILFILLLLPLSTRAQFIPKKDIPVYSCMFLAGACYGTAEAIIWHDPKPGNEFWSPYVSDGKKKVDAYHLARLGQNAFVIGAVCFSVSDFKKPKFLPIAKKVLLCSISYQVGQCLTYNVIFK